MKKLLFAVLLFAPSVLRADTIVAGSMKAPSQSLNYNFDVQQFVTATYVEDVLNGQVLFKDGAIGCHPCTTNYVNDLYLFGPTETVTLAQFGFNGSTWNLLGSLNSVRLVDPPSVATPEPTTWLLIAAGIGLMLVLWPRARKIGR